jgi:hypothetical protein
MSEDSVEIGPLTPQELDRICEVLKRDRVLFEIYKDEGTEKMETKSDFHNLVTKAEFRTESYLAQIYYLSLSPEAAKRYHHLWEKLGLASGIQETVETVEADELKVDSAEEWQQLRKGRLDAERRKYFVSSIILAVVIYYIIFDF